MKFDLVIKNGKIIKIGRINQEKKIDKIIGAEKLTVASGFYRYTRSR